MVPLHPDVERLAFLLGTWRGEGTGQYPTIDPFTYPRRSRSSTSVTRSSCIAGLAGRPDGSPLHFERGFLRPGGRGDVELCLAHPLGLTEVAHGRVSGGSSG